MNRLKSIAVFLSAACIGLLLASCGQKEEIPKTISYSLETAKTVSHVTSGLISIKEPIRVRFVDPVIQENGIGATIPRTLFSFQPKIKGNAVWEDLQTLVFRPDKPLKSRQDYFGRLDLAGLFPNKKDLKPLEFRFAAAGIELVSASCDFRPKDIQNPKTMICEGKVEFTESVDAVRLKESGLLKMDSKKVGLDWQGSGKVFSFQSSPFARTNDDRTCLFRLDGKPLGIPTDFEKEFVLPALSEMVLIGIRLSEPGPESRFTLTFSDDLDPVKDITGLIGVLPAVPSKTTAAGKDVFLSGKFEFGKKYTIRVRPGIRSRWGTVLREETSKTFTIEDLKPQFRFANDGVFLPSSNEQKIRFQTVNLRAVQIQVKKVFENNLVYFLQNENLNGVRSRNESFNNWEADRVGTDVANETLEIGDTRNAWLQHELDLKKLIHPGEKGLFLLSMTFERKDMLYGKAGVQEKQENQQWGYGEEYYSNPYSPGYVYRNGQLFKPIVLSDIGLTCKIGHEKAVVFATNLIDASPMPDVQITLRTYQNQTIAQKKTDNRGTAVFESVQQTVSFVEAETKDQRSVVKTDEMAWNLSSFDTGGEDVPPDGMRAFLYTERGVYRPGDDIHACLVARNQSETFPDGHPVTLKLYNPKNQKVIEKTQRDGKDGFNHFAIQTRPEDPTGNWRAEFEVGSKTFTQVIKIETVVPNRLKVLLLPEKSSLSFSDNRVRVHLKSAYLFGNPASEHEAQVEMTFVSETKTFSSFPNFQFVNESLNFQPVDQVVFSGNLDDQGETWTECSLPPKQGVPSALAAVIRARVMEKGGRPNLNETIIPIDPYPCYVGLSRPDVQWGAAQVGSRVRIPTVLVDSEGKPVRGRMLRYRIYRNRQTWWWEYENRQDYRLRFKTDVETDLAEQGKLVSGIRPVVLEFTPTDQGRYFVEVEDPGGHSAGLFLTACVWGEIPSGGDQADLVTLKADKKTYAPGDQAVISFPAPKEGSVLVTVEKAYDVLQTFWVKPDPRKIETRVSIPVTRDMMPNAYVSISVIQPHNQSANDRPIRMYGLIPVAVVEPSTKQELTVQTASSLEPGKPFVVDVATSDRKPTQFTIAVVDEGLLDLTRFTTPDIWGYFFRKIRLGVQTSDLFSRVIAANKGDVFRTFSIGGDMASEPDYRESQLGSEKTKRFRPVSMFQGPLSTDSNGRARVSFTMPFYVGSVRIMAVSAKKGCYGSAEKTVPVQSDLMVLSALPRVIGPGDRITVPVTVFAMKGGIGPVDVVLSAKGPVRIAGNPKTTLAFAEKGEKDATFTLEAEAAVGTATIVCTAYGGSARSVSETEIAVRASSPRMFETLERECLPGSKIALTIPDKGLDGTRQARIGIRRRPNVNFSGRLLWLVQYPYGCIEQTVSAAFPQLYLKKVAMSEAFDAKTIDENINGAIRRLRKFEIPSGGFGYWPGDGTDSPWGSNYAGHFLIEAKKLGYNVPEDLLNRWLRYQRSQALLSGDSLMVRVYRLYLLALAGDAQLGAMNLVKENRLATMNDVEKWLLAASYKLAGSERVASEIVKNAGTTVFNRRSRMADITYGSPLRDRAMILDVLVQMGFWDKANPIVDELARNLASNAWYSTQTTGYCLLALGKYFTAVEGDKNPVLSGTVRLPDGKSVPFKTETFGTEIRIASGFGRTVEVELDVRTTVKRAFVSLDYSWIPLLDESANLSNNLRLAVEWLDRDGVPMDASRLKQGTMFWGHFRAGKTTASESRINEAALVQVLPSGWEIENIRLSGEDLPDWMSKWNMHQEKYLDIRDDRTMWFFDFPESGGDLDFVVKLNAVTVGQFSLPPTLLEAMYDANFKALKAGGKAAVE